MTESLYRVSMAALGVVFSGLGIAGYFLAAGRWDLPAAWGLLAVMAVVSVYSGVTADRDLARERRRPGPGGQDTVLPHLARLLAIGGMVFAGLDVGRFHWSDTIPTALRASGVVASGIGMGFALWAVRVNRFFSSVIRLQEDRGHRLVTDGPYAWVRHPGYAGMFVAMPGMGLAFGSWLGAVPFLLLVGLLVRRLRLEDRFLHERLDGYVDYASRVRYRVLPGVW